MNPRYCLGLLRPLLAPARVWPLRHDFDSLGEPGSRCVHTVDSILSRFNGKVARFYGESAYVRDTMGLDYRYRPVSSLCLFTRLSRPIGNHKHTHLLGACWEYLKFNGSDWPHELRQKLRKAAALVQDQRILQASPDNSCHAGIFPCPPMRD